MAIKRERRPTTPAVELGDPEELEPKLESPEDEKPSVVVGSPIHRAYVLIPNRPSCSGELLRDDTVEVVQSGVDVIDLTDNAAEGTNVDTTYGNPSRKDADKKKLKKSDEKKPGKGCKDVAQLPPEEVHKMIQTMGLTEIPVEENKNTYRTITRGFLSAMYGGNSQDMYSRPSAVKAAEHGIEEFLCPNLSYNPNAAAMPGKPGLLYLIFDRPKRNPDLQSKKRKSIMQELSGVNHAEPKKSGNAIKPCPTFIRLATNTWLYLGNYIFDHGDALSAAQWRIHAESVKMTWAKNLLTSEWGRRIRTAILYRRLHGKDPFYEDVTQLEEQIKRGEVVFDLTVDEIYQALERGDERITVAGMQCTSYDAVFQDELIAKVDSWTPPAKAGKKEKPNNGKGKQRRVPKEESRIQSPKKKVKRDKSTSPSLLESEPEDGMDIDDLEAMAEPVYTRRGTRSRPLK